MNEMTKFQQIIVEPMPSSGPTPIKRDMLKKNWDKRFSILQYGGRFQLLCEGRAGGKVTLSPDDGAWAIEEMSLGAHMNGIFRRAVTWKD